MANKISQQPEVGSGQSMQAIPGSREGENQSRTRTCPDEIGRAGKIAVYDEGRLAFMCILTIIIRLLIFMQDICN